MDKCREEFEKWAESQELSTGRYTNGEYASFDKLIGMIGTPADEVPMVNYSKGVVTIDPAPVASPGVVVGWTDGVNVWRRR